MHSIQIERWTIHYLTGSEIIYTGIEIIYTGSEIIYTGSEMIYTGSEIISQVVRYHIYVI